MKLTPSVLMITLLFVTAAWADCRWVKVCDDHGCKDQRICSSVQYPFPIPEVRGPDIIRPIAPIPPVGSSNCRQVQTCDEFGECRFISVCD